MHSAGHQPANLKYSLSKPSFEIAPKGKGNQHGPANVQFWTNRAVTPCWVIRACLDSLDLVEFHRRMHIISGWGPCFTFFAANRGQRSCCGAWARQESGRVCSAGFDDRQPAPRGWNRREAGRLCGLSRTAAYEWHNRYEEEASEGLRDRPRPGRQPLVARATAVRLKERIVAGADLAAGRGGGVSAGSTRSGS